MTKKNFIDSPDIDEKEILEMIANNNIQDRLAPKREQIEKSGENVPSESTMPTASHNQSSKNEEVVLDRQPKKTLSGKQRKANLLEYQQAFLSVPRIIDRKTVFISNNLRERIVEVVRRFGVEKSSVSGFVENLLIHHLEMYQDDIEGWKKL